MPKVLLVSTVTWSCAERLAGALAGATVEAVFPQGHAMAHSRHLGRAHTYRALWPLRSIRCAIARSRPDLVIPCEDRAALLLADIHAQGTDEERALLARSLGRPALYGDLYRRPYFIAEAVKSGVCAAAMLPAPDRESLTAGIRQFGLPLVIKSDCSWGGEGVAIAHTAEDALQAWRRLSRTPSRARQLARAVLRRDPHFLAQALRPVHPTVGVQRFIAGRPATSSLLCWQGEVLAAHHFDVEITGSARGPATVLSPRDCAAMEDAGRRIAARFGLSGLIGLDFIRDEQGHVFLLEINPRATPTSHLALGTGRDPCGALLTQLGLSTGPRPAVTQARQIALFPQEWRRDAQSPWLLHAFHDVPWDDPGVIWALTRDSWRQNQARDRSLNDKLAGEFGPLLAPAGETLTIRQSAGP
jgi:hypothetical protein